jgi:hypothetical protein
MRHVGSSCHQTGNFSSSHKRLRSKVPLGGSRTVACDFRKCGIRSIPYEKVSNNCEEYEIRLYTPRIVVETPYKTRDAAYIAFDQYLTGESSTHLIFRTVIKI